MEENFKNFLHNLYREADFQNLITLPKKRLLLRQGQKLDRVYLLLSGEVEIFSYGAEGERIISSYLRPPQFLGLVEYLSGDSTSIAGVYTRSEVTVLSLSFPQVEALLKDEMLNRHLLTYVARLSLENIRSREKEKRLSKRDQIVDFLYYSAIGQDLPYTFPQSKEELSDYFNIPERTFYRYLASLEEEGLIVRERGKIQITESTFPTMERFMEPFQESI